MMERQICVSCDDQTNGEFQCNQCQQSFCWKHLQDHRSSMQQEIDHLIDKCDRLRQRWDQNQLFQQIDQWENDFIENIKKEANVARTELQALIQQYEQSFKKLSTDIQQSKQSNNYSEMNIIQWIEELNHINCFSIQIETQPFNNHIEIKQNNKRQLEQDEQNVKRSKNNSSLNDEKFHQVLDSHAKLYQNNLIVTNQIYSRSFISGQNSYSIGKYSFSIKIEGVNKTEKGSSCFFGLMTSNETMKEPFSDMKSVYGVWSSGYNVIAGQKSTSDRFKRWEEKDIVTFTFDCDRHQFTIENKRIHWCPTFDIDINLTPFPWKFLTIIKGYRLRILNYS